MRCRQDSVHPLASLGVILATRRARGVPRGAPTPSWSRSRLDTQESKSVNGPDTKQEIRATQLRYLCPSHIGPRLQILRPPQEPPLDLQVHRGRAALESAGHLHILPLRCCHIPRKLGKFCWKTETHPFGICTLLLTASLVSSLHFPGSKQTNKQTNKKKNPLWYPRGSPHPFPWPLSYFWYHA